MSHAADRPRWPTTLRLALAGGRADGMRIGLTALGAAGAAVALLVAASVAVIGPNDGPYPYEVLTQPGLRPGVVVVMLLLCVPILVFVGLCTRVGAPARDRRLAAIRMAGATPAEVRRVVWVETGLSAGLGSLVGGAAWLVGGAVVQPSPQVVRTYSTDGGGVIFSELVTAPAYPLPVDVAVPWWLLVLCLALVPAGATLSARVAMRRVGLSPFGVVRHERSRPPALAPAVLVLVGFVGLAAWEPIAASTGLSLEQGLGAYAGVSAALFVVTLVGLVFGAASIASLLGRLLAPRTGSPALLIASRRLMAAPFTASRAAAAVTFAVLLGAAVQGTRANILVQTDPGQTFYADTFDQLDVVLALGIVIAAAGLLVITAEGIVTRRRTLAGLTAAGTPRRTLAAAVLVETVLPLVPTVLLAATAGLLAARGVLGSSVQVYDSSGIAGDPEARMVGVPVPWVELGTLAGGTIAVVLVVTASALIFLRRSTNISEVRAAA